MNFVYICFLFLLVFCLVGFCWCIFLVFIWVWCVIIGGFIFCGFMWWWECFLRLLCRWLVLWMIGCCRLCIGVSLEFIIGWWLFLFFFLLCWIVFGVFWMVCMLMCFFCLMYFICRFFMNRLWYFFLSRYYLYKKFIS